MYIPGYGEVGRYTQLYMHYRLQVRVYIETTGQIDTKTADGHEYVNKKLQERERERERAKQRERERETERESRWREDEEEGENQREAETDMVMLMLIFLHKLA